MRGIYPADGCDVLGYHQGIKNFTHVLKGTTGNVYHISISTYSFGDFFISHGCRGARSLRLSPKLDSIEKVALLRVWHLDRPCPSGGSTKLFSGSLTFPTSEVTIQRGICHIAVGVGKGKQVISTRRSFSRTEEVSWRGN